MTGSGPVRRTLTVLVVYAACAFLVLVLGGWLRQILVLPVIFQQLLEWGVYLGAVVAAVVAWHYPTIAAESSLRMDAPGSGRRVEDPDPDPPQTSRRR